jgi:DNA-binding CsgD family transcriptional regulator/tetratricopeptide (TPR) repeat protein/energy-coupling factor transporter ATP-binding protein EcfA2
MDQRDVPQRGAAGGETLIGRRGELATVRALVERARSSGEALLIIGEPGVGKTMLLDAAAGMASSAGACVLRASGVEFEAGISFSGLNQTLLPLLAELAHLTAAYRNALNVALGFGEGPAPDRLVVSNATLALLRQAAVARPVLVVIDDLPWLDRASAEVLGFVARRLAGSRVGVLGASRSGEESFFDRVGLPELELQPLDDDAAGKLVLTHFPTLGAPIRQRILSDAQGNPLALLELPSAWNAERHSPLEGLPSTLPLSRRLQAVFGSRIAALPAPSRKLLLLMALDGTADMRVLRIVDGPTLRDLDAAEQARLTYIDRGSHRLAFRHPLIRAAVVDLATADERREANRVLAELWADQPDRRAWHLAEATVEPDEDVAAPLEQAAHRVLARGDVVASVAALTRAAELSPLTRDRNRRLAAAAYIGMDVTGELRSASRLIDEVRRVDPELKGSLRAAGTAAAVLLNADGDVDTAHRLLVDAIESRGASNKPGDTELTDALHTLLQVCYAGGRDELWEPFDRAIARIAPDIPAALYLGSKTLADPARTPAAVLEQLSKEIDGLGNELDPTRIVRLAIASNFVDRVPGCRDALWRVVRAGREEGAIASGLFAMILLGVDDFWSGQWDEAERLLDEATALCDVHGYRFLSMAARAMLGLVAAARGDDDATRALCDEMLQWATPRRVGAVQCFAWQVQALAAIGRGDFEEAYRQASNISSAGTIASHLHGVQDVLIDLVEAAVHTGRYAEAAAHVAAIRESNIAALSSRFALFADGAAAIAAADDGSAIELFGRALDIPGADRWAFVMARVQLAYGERLRRMPRMTDARVQLAAAIETFERLGARPWADRARNELRATGQTKPRVDPYTRVPLTPQEGEIASLAAAGLTNKQIAERLFLSPRTVGSHLHRIFPKLGIATRAALRDALAAAPQAPPGGTDEHP